MWPALAGEEIAKRWGKEANDQLASKVSTKDNKMSNTIFATFVETVLLLG